MRAGWFAFLDGRSGLMSECRLGAGSASGAVGVVSPGWWGNMGFALWLVYFQLFGGCGGVVSGWWCGWGLSGLFLIHCESKFNLLSLSIEHLVSSFSLCNFISCLFLNLGTFILVNEVCNIFM